MTLRPPITDADHCLGAEQAPATLVEYGDYECPHCAAAHLIVQDVRRRMGDRLRYAFRHFPLASLHPHAERAAEAAEAAAAQGRFWEMHDSLFAQPDALEDGDLVRRAAKLGLDVSQFTDELAAGQHLARVRRDFQSGIRSGVNGTPTFYINDERHDEAWDADSLVEALSQAAAQA